MSSSLRRTFVIFVGSVVMGLVSCGGGGKAGGGNAAEKGAEGGPCDDAECDAGLVCRDGSCVKAVNTCSKDDAGCVCAILSESSSGNLPTSECNAASVPHSRCCADADFPNLEYSKCTCHGPELAWRCVSKASGGTFLRPGVSCGCNYHFNETESGQVTSCSEPSNVCCTGPDEQSGLPRCDCFAGTKTCPTGYTASQSCQTPPVEPPKCQTGTSEVSDCGVDATPTGPSPSGGSSSGGGSSGGGSSGSNLCTPKGGTCEDSGDCACGEGCLKTSSCSTCSQYCVHPCDTNQDCIEWSKGLTSPYNTCHSGSLFNYCQ